MLVAKISFYFESAKKTGEKFWEKFGFRNHHTAISSTQQVSRHDEGSIRHLSSWHIDPCFLESQNVFVTIFKGIGPFEVATCLLEILTYDVGTKLPNS